MTDEWYAVVSHLGSLTFTRRRPPRESLYCDDCNDRDDVYGPIRFTPDGTLALAESLCACPLPPAPWEDAGSWLDGVGANLDWIAREAPVPVDAAMLKRRARRRLWAWWASNGLLPFDRHRCERFFRETAPDCRPTSAGAALDWDWADETDPQTPVILAPWLGCLLEARMRAVPGYRVRWLDMMDKHPGWRLTPVEAPDGMPWRIPMMGGGTIAVQWFAKERRRG